MSKHTPGPWVVCPGTQFEDMEPRVLANGGRHAVASVKLTGNIQKEANARLIAAAPQLVEALDSLIGWAVMRSDWAAAGKSEPTDHPIQRARAALKSAGVSHE